MKTTEIKGKDSAWLTAYSEQKNQLIMYSAKLLSRPHSSVTKPFFSNSEGKNTPFFLQKNKVQKKSASPVTTDCAQYRRNYFDTLLDNFKNRWDNKINCNSADYKKTLAMMVNELAGLLQTYKFDLSSGMCCTTLYRYVIEKNEIVINVPDRIPEKIEEEKPMGEPLNIEQKDSPAWEWKPLEEKPVTPEPPREEKQKLPEKAPEKTEEKPKKESFEMDPCQPFFYLEDYYANYESLKDVFQERNMFSRSIKIVGAGDLMVSLHEGYASPHPECLFI